LLSSFIDGSAIYGMSASISQTLRTFSNGLLKTSPGLFGNGSAAKQETLSGRTYLPLSNDTCSASVNPAYNCFYAGEFRTSENLGLVSIQTLFNREHNRIATQLASINPSWRDEKIFQETRRIVISELQHITYNEFVPLLVGNASLAPLKIGYYNGYNANVN
jgi:peroxidase